MDPIVGERCTMCPYMGTHYCITLCEDWQGTIIEECDLECGECPHAKSCPCTKYALPREIDLEGTKYFLTNPNTPPHHNTTAYIALYGRPPQFLEYIEKWGLFVMGPVMRT